jgi:hypothetical protein
VKIQRSQRIFEQHKPNGAAVSMELRFVEMQDANCVPASTPAWLSEVREMRGRVCYDQGHRPSFRTTNGRFEDADTVDLSAYHVIVRSLGKAVGCARLLPLARVRSGVISSAIGPERFSSILMELGTTRENTAEASRWIVVPEFRGGMGPRIVAAVWAVTRWLSLEFVFVMAGTRQRQDLALIHMGAQALSDIALVRSDVFDDELRLLYFNVHRPRPFKCSHIDRAAVALNLTA